MEARRHVIRLCILTALAMPALLPAAPLAITGPPPPGTDGVPYRQQFSATGGAAPYTWNVHNGTLPPGLSLGPAGLLYGIPDAGTFQFAVRVEDSAGKVASLSVTMQILPAPIAFLTLSPLPAGIVGLEYPQQIIEADGGAPPFTFSIPTTSLPPGLTFTNGVLGGLPSMAGAFSLPLLATDSLGASAATSLALAIRRPTTDLTVSLGAVSFFLAAGASSTTAARNVSVQSSVAAQTIGFKATPPADAPWLTVSSGGATPETLNIALNPKALALAPGAYRTSVVLTCTSAVCNGNPQTILVGLTVNSPPPRLSVKTDILSFDSTPAVPKPPSQPVTIENSGAGALSISGITCDAPWCTVAGVPPLLLPGPAALIAVSADPAGLAPGFYRTLLRINTASNNATVPVTLLISQGALVLTPGGTQVRSLTGGLPGNPAGSFRLAVTGAGQVNWTATVLPGAEWLQLKNVAGTVSAQQPASVGYAIDPAAAAALAPKAYYGAIRISSAKAVNSPVEFRVVLRVFEAGDPPRPEPAPSGLVFVTSAGAPAPLSQAVQVYSIARAPSAYSASAATVNGGGWLTVAPAAGTTSSSQPASSTVSVNQTGLAPGVYRGAVSFAFAGAAVRSVNVTLIVRPAGASVPQGVPVDRPAAAACVPSAVVPAHTGLVNNFSTPTSWPVPLEIRLLDDCGGLVVNGQVTATFTNGDAPLPMPLSDAASGVYSATWTPRRTGSQVTVTAQATAPGLISATTQIAGEVQPNAAPSLSPHGTVHSFNPLAGGSLAPGTIVAIYGFNMAQAAKQPTVVPLPVSVDGTAVVIGGLAAPLYYVSPGQINAQIPFELNPANQYQIVVMANGSLTTPDVVQMAPVTPGLAEYADGMIVAQHQDGSLITTLSPAKPGEYAVMYLAGMGGTDNPVATGSGSPGSPLARPVFNPVLTLNGAPVPVAFAGLTPGLVGLYQLNFQIPAGTPAGNTKLVVSQTGVGSNLTLLPIGQ